MPVKCPLPITIIPSLTCTSPRLLNGVSLHPLRDWPSVNGTHSPGGLEAWPARTAEPYNSAAANAQHPVIAMELLCDNQFSKKNKEAGPPSANVAAPPAKVDTTPSG